MHPFLLHFTVGGGTHSQYAVTERSIKWSNRCVQVEIQISAENDLQFIIGYYFTQMQSRSPNKMPRKAKPLEHS